MIKKISSLLILLSFLGSSYSLDVEFESNKTSFDSKKEILLLEGDVSLKYENLIFKADKVEFDKKNDLFTSKKLTFSSFDNYLYGSANEVEILKKNVILKKVEFSSCPCSNKIWWIESKELNFKNGEDFISAKNSKLIVQGRTLAFINKANFPINYERKTGILLPEVSINERSGLDVKIPIYLNLKTNLDLVIEPRVMTQRGIGLNNELRYLGKSYEGFFNFSALNDSKSSYKNLESDSLRWSYNLNHFQNIDSSTFFDLRASSAGDPFYLSDLGSIVSGLSRTFVLPNKVEISHFGRNYILKADINSFKLVNPLGVNQYQRFPGLDYKYFFNDRNFNFSLDSDFAFYRKGGSYRNNDKQKLTRIFINPKISYAYFNKNYFLETSFLMKYLFKEIDDSSNSELLSTLKINNFFNFYEKKENSNLKIQPFLNFSISDQKKIINQVNVDSGLRMSSLNENSEFGDLFVSNQNDLNIGTKILSKKGKNLVNVKIQKLFTFGTKKIFIEDKKILLPEPLTIRIKYKSNSKIQFESYYSFDDDENYSLYKNSFQYRKKDFNLSLGHRLIKNIKIYNLGVDSLEKKKINSLEITSRFNFSKNWSGGIKVINDLEQESNVNSVISIDYENEGLVLGFTYVNSLQLDWESILENNNFKDYHSDRFRLFFELKGLGSLGRPKEDFLRRRSL